MFLPTVTLVIRLNPWKMKPIFLRSSRSCAPLIPVISVPSMSTLPPVGRSRRLMVRTSVDLPAPENPTMPKISPFSTLRLTCFTASMVRLPSWKVTDTSSSSMTLIFPRFV